VRGIAIVLGETPDGEPTVDVERFDGTFSDVQRICGGNVEVAPADDAVTVFVNEDGKGVLARNVVADLLWMLFDVYGCLPSGDYLCGSVVFLGGVDADGETTDLPFAIEAQIVARVEDILGSVAVVYGEEQ
jgi:hypothetical protein